MKTFIENFNLSFINDYALFIYLISAVVVLCFMIAFVLKIMKLNQAVTSACEMLDSTVNLLEDSKLKSEAIVSGTRKRSGLVFKTLALFNVMRYTMNKDNRDFARRMRDYEKHQEDKNRLI